MRSPLLIPRSPTFIRCLLYQQGISLKYLLACLPTSVIVVGPILLYWNFLQSQWFDTADFTQGVLLESALPKFCRLVVFELSPKPNTMYKLTLGTQRLYCTVYVQIDHNNFRKGSISNSTSTLPC